MAIFILDDFNGAAGQINEHIPNVQPEGAGWYWLQNQGGTNSLNYMLLTGSGACKFDMAPSSSFGTAALPLGFAGLGTSEWTLTVDWVNADSPVGYAAYGGHRQMGLDILMNEDIRIAVRVNRMSDDGGVTSYDGMGVKTGALTGNIFPTLIELPGLVPGGAQDPAFAAGGTYPITLEVKASTIDVTMLGVTQSIARPFSAAARITDIRVFLLTQTSMSRLQLDIPDAADGTAPVITGPGGSTGATSSINHPENSTAVHTFVADEAVTWAIDGGQDQEKFQIDAAGLLSFVTAPDFELPTDGPTSGSNTYEVLVRATDPSLNTSTQLVLVSVTDGFDASAFFVRAAAPSPLGTPLVLVVHDFSGLMGDLQTVYVMDLQTPSGAVRVPISSWQATLQTDGANYMQCVIPACLAWVDTLAVATEFVIYRRAVLPSGVAMEYEMVRAPTGQVQFDRGAQRYTCTLSGYSDAFAASENPPAVYDRALTGLRSVSQGSTKRVRCAVDWLLRPGHRAFVDGVPMVVRYINYYAPTGFDSYMDVGE